VTVYRHLVMRLGIRAGRHQVAPSCAYGSVSLIFTRPYSVFEAEFRTPKEVNADKQRIRSLVNGLAVGACPSEERINLLCA